MIDDVTSAHSELSQADQTLAPASRLWVLLFASVLLFVNSWVLLIMHLAATRLEEGWDEIAGMHVIVAIANLLAVVAGLTACGFIKICGKPQSVRWLVFASILLPVLAAVGLVFAIELFAFVFASGP